MPITCLSHSEFAASNIHGVLEPHLPVRCRIADEMASGRRKTETQLLANKTIVPPLQMASILT